MPGDRVTPLRQWSIAISAVTALGFGTALAVKVWPQLDLVGAGSRAPGFHAVNLRTAQPASLASYRDRVILLNVWATWCPPCRVEMPSLERLQRKLGGPGFAVVAVSIDEGDSRSDEVRATAGVELRHPPRQGRGHPAHLPD